MSTAEILSKNQKYLAEKRSFEGKCKVLRTIFQPKTLSAEIPASQKGIYLFYNVPMHLLILTRLSKNSDFLSCKTIELALFHWLCFFSTEIIRGQTGIIAKINGLIITLQACLQFLLETLSHCVWVPPISDHISSFAALFQRQTC